MLVPNENREPFLRRVVLKNYKSIGKCDITLHPLTVLVGRNGAGKSNFLDALAFVTDALTTSLDHALKSRGGIKSVRRRSTGHPRNLRIELEFNLPEQRVGRYAFELAARKDEGFSVKREQLEILTGASSQYYRIGRSDTQTRIESSQTHPPQVLDDRLYLVTASSVPAFRPAFDALISMGFYNLNPDAIKELQSPDAGELLHRDGGNLASVLARLDREEPETKSRIEQFLARIVPGVAGADHQSLGPRETIEFRQDVAGAEHPWRFYAQAMSDGTLRALGTLVSVRQFAHRQSRVHLTGIEEPETALHPSAAGALMDALREATTQTQVLVTTHSADLLDRLEDADGLLAVISEKGETSIAPVSAAGKTALREHLYTAGELLRMDQLEPDRKNISRQRQTSLFDSAGAAP